MKKLIFQLLVRLNYTFKERDLSFFEQFDVINPGHVLLNPDGTATVKFDCYIFESAKKNKMGEISILFKNKKTIEYLSERTPEKYTKTTGDPSLFVSCPLEVIPNKGGWKFEQMADSKEIFLGVFYYGAKAPLSSISASSV
ncbi:MAG: hypothetical protein OEX08_00950 [Candidatus Nomurabacteria bacterium]|nr:hypothetical protein [Candidatus Nomurabacteria bacterium]